MKRTLQIIACSTVLLLIGVRVHVDAAQPSASTRALPNPASPAEVNIDNFLFGPQTVTVSTGTTVKWTNKDDVPHNVVDENGGFRSKTLDTDEDFSHTFDKAGTYKYYCAIHPKMQGTVVVK